MRYILIILLSSLSLLAACHEPEIQLNDNPNDEGSDIDYTLSPNFGKSLGIFGGSFSNIEESDSCKFYWQELLQLTLFGHGINGAGYSNLTQERGVLQYARHAQRLH